MEKQKNTQLLVIAILSVTLLVMSVGFAGYSSVLNITGNVTAQASTWKVEFDTESYQETSGVTGATSVASANRSLTGTTMSFNVTLAKPGDFYEFTVDVKNTGTFDAELTSAVIPAISSPYSNYLRYTVSYQATKGTGSFVNLTNGDIASPYALAKTNGVATVKVKVEYFPPENANLLPQTDATTTFTVSLHYEQA